MKRRVEGPMKRRYSVLRERTCTVEAVVMAASPREALARAMNVPHDKWQPIDAGGMDAPDSITERRKNGKSFAIEPDGRIVETEDLPW